MAIYRERWQTWRLDKLYSTKLTEYFDIITERSIVHFIVTAVILKLHSVTYGGGQMIMRNLKCKNNVT